MSFNEIISMGGYGAYVWPAYGITLFVFGINFILSFLEKRRVKKMINHYLNQLS